VVLKSKEVRYPNNNLMIFRKMWKI
jgi:hypothetical protein